MGLLDDAIGRQEREELARARRYAEELRPAVYPPELKQVIAEFLSRGIPADTLPTGGRGSIVRAFLRMKQTDGISAWILFTNRGDTIADSGPYLILTPDGFLRIHSTELGWFPISQSFSGRPIRGPRLSITEGSLTRHVTEALARIVRSARRL
jgi:hypothetical protein